MIIYCSVKFVMHEISSKAFVMREIAGNQALLSIQTKLTCTPDIFNKELTY